MPALPFSLFCVSRIFYPMILYSHTSKYNIKIWVEHIKNIKTYKTSWVEPIQTYPPIFFRMCDHYFNYFFWFWIKNGELMFSINKFQSSSSPYYCMFLRDCIFFFLAYWFIYVYVCFIVWLTNSFPAFYLCVCFFFYMHLWYHTCKISLPHP